MTWTGGNGAGGPGKGAIGTVRALYRYPVKSMQGEQVGAVLLRPGGIAGDRSYALVDEGSGRVASAHHPGKWGRLLHCRARWEGEPDEGGVVVVTLPDGSEHQVGPELAGRLSKLLGREVSFVREAPEGGSYEIVHPDVAGTAPESFVRQTLEAAGVRDGRVGRLAVGLFAPKGALVDCAPVHVVATSSLAALAAAGGDADLRRYRPNVVVGTEGSGYTEAAWMGTRIRVGATALRIVMPTPRCIMTTLDQAGGVGRDKAPLTVLARDNCLAMGEGKWACLGVYATPEAAGEVTVGEAALGLEGAA